MFDIGWSELLVIGVVTLIMVGPKELPVFLRTIGKYVGMLRRQAAEFRSQFDAALRETELEQIRRDMAGLKDDVSGTMRAAQTQMESELNATGKALEETATAVERPVVTSQTARDEEFTDENGLPFKPTPSYEDLVSPDARQAPPGTREMTAAEMAAEGAETAALAATTAPVKVGNGTAHGHQINGSGSPSTSRGEA